MNLRDVARKAGVSVATVSRVLNDVDVVKAPTRNRVLKTVRAMNYHPNVNARALSVRKNRTLALLVSNLENPYFVEIYRVLAKEAHLQGYEILVADTDYSPVRLAANVQLMLGRRVAGIAAVVSEMAPSVIEELSRSGIPVAISGVDARGPSITSIRVNCAKGMQRLVDHLRTLRHRKLAFLDHHSPLESISERRKAFLDEIGPSAGAEVRVFTESDSLEGGRQAVRNLLASGFKPTGIACVNDPMAIGALKELRERGIRIPEDVSITGFDNISYSEFITPALTTVHIDRERIARLIFESLTRSGDPFPPSREVVVDPQLVLRESTGPASA